MRQTCMICLQKNLMNNTEKKPRIAFFGTPEMAVYVLEALKSKGYTPNLIITAPSKPKGRKLILTPPEVKVWADQEGIECIQPEKIRTQEFEELLKSKSPEGWDLFIVAAYGKIIPQNIFNMPRGKTLNVHPSLLPLFRGPAPLEYSILENHQNTGVTIIQIDEAMDHGPIIAQKKITITPWPMDYLNLEQLLATEGGLLLADSIKGVLDGSTQGVAQDEASATYTQKIKKEDGLISLTDNPEKTLLKIKAFTGWPRTFLLVPNKETGKDERVIILDALIENNTLVPTRVIPEGKKEMSWSEYTKRNKSL